MGLIGFFAASISEVDAGAFNAGYRFAWLSLLVTGGVGRAFNTCLCMALGKGDAGLARRLVCMLLTINFCWLALSASLAATFVDTLARVFTSDPEVIGRFVEARYHMGAFFFFMGASVVLESVLYSLKRAPLVFRFGLIG